MDGTGEDGIETAPQENERARENPFGQERTPGDQVRTLVWGASGVSLRAVRRTTGRGSGCQLDWECLSHLVVDSLRLLGGRETDSSCIKKMKS